MFRQSARESALLARIVEHSKCVFQLQTQRSKGKGEKIKDLMYQEFNLYGKVVEAKQDKLKRIEKEADEKIPGAESSLNDNSELAWVLKMQYSGKSRALKKITPSKLLIVPRENQSVRTNAKVSYDEKRVQTTEKVKSKSTFKENSVNKDSVDKNVTNKKSNESKKSSLLSSTLIQKLLEFPIVETYKSPDDKWSSDCKIMSLSAMQEKSCLKYPSVTRILSATMTEEAKAVLERWKMNMIEKLGEKGFDLYQAGIDINLIFNYNTAFEKINI